MTPPPRKGMTAIERLTKIRQAIARGFFGEAVTQIIEAKEAAREEGRQEGLKQELERSMQICKEAVEEGYAEGFRRGQRKMREMAAKIVMERAKEKLSHIHSSDLIRALPIDSGERES